MPEEHHSDTDSFAVTKYHLTEALSSKQPQYGGWTECSTTLMCAQRSSSLGRQHAVPLSARHALVAAMKRLLRGCTRPAIETAANDAVRTL